MRYYLCHYKRVKVLKFMQNTFLNKFNAWAIKSNLGKVGTFPVDMSHHLPKTRMCCMRGTKFFAPYCVEKINRMI